MVWTALKDFFRLSSLSHIWRFCSVARKSCPSFFLSLPHHHHVKLEKSSPIIHTCIMIDEWVSNLLAVNRLIRFPRAHLIRVLPSMFLVRLFQHRSKWQTGRT